MGEYKLNVHITGKWVKELKEMGFNLCVARKVNDEYTVVWTSKDDYNFLNEFTWVDKYRVGAIQKFEHGTSLLKLAVAEPQPIDFGQTVVREPDGVLSPATGQATPNGTSFTLQNKGAKTWVVVDQMIGATFQTVWADRLGIPNAKMVLTPRPKVMVFFDRRLSASSMFVDVEGPTYEVDFTDAREKSVYCVDSTIIPNTVTWVEDVGKQFGEPVPMSYSVSDGFQPMSTESGGGSTGDEAGEGHLPV